MSLEVMQVGLSLWVIRPHITWGIEFEVGQRALLAELLEQFAIRHYVCWYYTPMALGFSNHLKPEATVYDCMDELSGFLNPPPMLGVREQQLFAAADVVFTGGISLFEAKQKQHHNVHAFPSSIEIEHFAQAKSEQIALPADQKDIAHPRAGFYGVIDERFDVALLAEIALMRPHIHFIMLGPVVKIDPAALPEAANIHYLGSKSYGELPGYLAGWDAALMPFALNDATRFISPTKTPEYLAAGKTVVSTPIRDVVRGYGDAGLVAIADSAEKFVTALDLALEPQTESWHKAVVQKLGESSWDSTWAAMRDEIDRVRSKSVPLLPSTYERDIAKDHQSELSASHALTPVLATLRIDGLNSRAELYASSRTHRHKQQYDYLVVGAGFAGSVLAERIASQLGKRVLIVDKRDHIGGNAYDFKNADGILVHQYGPHIFHTNSDAVVSYLSQFTSWRPYEHRVLASVDGHLVPVPINLDTINTLYGLSLDAAGMQAFLDERVVASPFIQTSEQIVMSRVGRELYEKFFRNYTRKQWGLDPSQLDASVAGRIPVRLDRDDRYFTDTFQAMPLKGYTRMFERMLDHSKITIRTGTSYEEALRLCPDAKVIYTGPIDEYFGFRYGPLPYRSLEFKHETHDVEIYQAAPVVNYPNEHKYTRVTEFKYLTGQQHKKTSIVYEYPQSMGDPYYPIPRPENALLYARYRELAEQDGNVHFCGRLANYKYLNMDQVVAQALATYRRIAKQESVAFAPLEAASNLTAAGELEAIAQSV
ncbi:UDP-galactopyranose mutase [Granulicella arctica]|uniref:UDP-galactopyranose mutase n=1 Tax=Granulicella arctica TaxID=940613 RepID=UPI0021E0DE4A|nr:UDP-galactopyranose mutase [Granulicella arctica]